MAVTKAKLHPTQTELLSLLARNVEEPLTIRALVQTLNLSSTSVVAHHLLQLEKKGYIKRNSSNPRDYQVVSDGPEKAVTYVNLYGLARCGREGNILDGNPIDRIPIASRILNFPADQAFMVKAKGDSMAPKICEGDYVIAQKANSAISGSVVVCVNGEDAMIKKLYMEYGRPILTSINSKYQPILANQDFRIIGEVKHIIAAII